GSVGSASVGTASRGPYAAKSGSDPRGASTVRNLLRSKAPSPASYALWSRGPRAFPPRIAKAGPPGSCANRAIWAAAAPRFTSGWAFSVAAHCTLHIEPEKNAKLTVSGWAARVIVVVCRPIGGDGPVASNRQTAAVYQFGERDGRIVGDP